MTIYTNRFKDHGIHAKLAELEDQTSKLSPNGAPGSSRFDVANRLREGLAYCRGLLNSANAEWAARPVLNSALEQLTQVGDNLRAFLSNGSESYLETANNHLLAKTFFSADSTKEDAATQVVLGERVVTEILKTVQKFAKN